MALLSFSPQPAKGASTEVTLSKNELLLCATGDEYFSQEENITKVEVYYTSNPGKQKKKMEFLFLDAVPKASLSFHARARSSFLLTKIVLINHAGDKITLDREEIANASMYDISLG